MMRSFFIECRQPRRSPQAKAGAVIMRHLKSGRLSIAGVELLLRRRRHAERREFRLRARDDLRAVEDDAQLDWFAGGHVNRLNALAVVGMANEDLVSADGGGNRSE